MDIVLECLGILLPHVLWSMACFFWYKVATLRLETIVLLKEQIDLIRQEQAREYLERFRSRAGDACQ